MVTEPLSNAQLADIGWANRQGLSDIPNQFHYYRLTEDNRILWGGYDAIYYWRGKINAELESRPETWAKLSKHFFDTFPQLEGVKFTHAWGGAIDTCSRFCVFWGQAMQGRVAYALGYTGLGVASSRFGGEVMLDLLDGKRSRATQTEFVKERPLPFPPEPFRFIGIQTTTMVARTARTDRQAQRCGCAPSTGSASASTARRCDRVSDRSDDRAGVDDRADRGVDGGNPAVLERRAVGDVGERSGNDRDLQRRFAFARNAERRERHGDDQLHRRAVVAGDGDRGRRAERGDRVDGRRRRVVGLPLAVLGHQPGAVQG